MITRVVVLTAVLASGGSFLRAFPAAPLLLTVAVAGLAPAVLELGGRAGRAVTAVACVAALFVLLHGAALDLLGMTMPAPATLPLLAVPAGLCWLAASLGLEVARHARGTPSLAALLPVLAIWTVSGLLARYGGFFPWPAFLVAACAGVQLLRQSAGAGRWPALAGLAAVAAVAGLAVPSLAAQPVRRKADPRSLVPAVALPPATGNPIDWVDVWLTDPSQVLFRTDADAPVRYWTWTVLTSYDGVQWRPPDRYARAGLGVPPAGPASDTVHQTVTVDHLPGPFLPAAGRPVRIAAPVAGVDVDTGTLITGRAVGSGFAYSVSARPAPPPADARCGAAEPADLPPELAGSLRALAGTGCSGSFADFSRQVQQRLDAGRTNLAGVASAGTSVGVLKDFLAPGGRGTVVEFDSAYALALRAAGIPARLVVGFQPADARRVTGADVRLWVEARLPGSGWLTVHPDFPTARKASARPLRTATPDPTTSPPAPPRSAAASPPTPTPVTGAAHRTARPFLPWVALAVAGYLLPVLLVPRLRRGLRRRRGHRRNRAAGAWHDVLDELAFTVGTPRLRSATPASTGQLARAAPGDMTTVTRTAEQALFATRPPTETEIREAWHAAARVRRRLRRRAGPTGRLARSLSWRNLRPRSPWW